MNNKSETNGGNGEKEVRRWWNLKEITGNRGSKVQAKCIEMTNNMDRKCFRETGGNNLFLNKEECKKWKKRNNEKNKVQKNTKSILAGSNTVAWIEVKLKKDKEDLRGSRKVDSPGQDPAASMFFSTQSLGLQVFSNICVSSRRGKTQRKKNNNTILEWWINQTPMWFFWWKKFMSHWLNQSQIKFAVSFNLDWTEIPLPPEKNLWTSCSYSASMKRIHTAKGFSSMQSSYLPLINGLAFTEACKIENGFLLASAWLHMGIICGHINGPFFGTLSFVFSWLS